MLPTDRLPRRYPRFRLVTFSTVAAGAGPLAQGLDGPPTGKAQVASYATMVPTPGTTASTSSCSGTGLGFPYGLADQASKLRRHVVDQGAPCRTRWAASQASGTRCGLISAIRVVRRRTAQRSDEKTSIRGGLGPRRTTVLSARTFDTWKVGAAPRDSRMFVTWSDLRRPSVSAATRGILRSNSTEFGVIAVSRLCLGCPPIPQDGATAWLLPGLPVDVGLVNAPRCPTS